jgi:hypothetical protein
MDEMHIKYDWYLETKSQNWCCGNPTLRLYFFKEIEAIGKSLPDDYFI